MVLLAAGSGQSVQVSLVMPMPPTKLAPHGRQRVPVPLQAAGRWYDHGEHVTGFTARSGECPQEAPEPGLLLVGGELHRRLHCHGRARGAQLFGASEKGLSGGSPHAAAFPPGSARKGAGLGD